MEAAPAARAKSPMAVPSYHRPDLLERVLVEANAAATDGHLLQRFIDEGDQTAFGAILDRHGPMLLGMCRRGATLGAALLASLVAPSAVRAVLTAELRRGVLTVAASALQPAAIAPAILMLANGELRMSLFMKCLLGSALILAVTAALT